MNTTVIVFLLVYVALALGHLPGFRVDRTGAAVVGAMAMIGFGVISDRGAWLAINYHTVGLLFGLMVVSGAFVISGFYAWLARAIASLDVSPPLLLALLVGAGGVLSALLTNDVVVVAMTPLLIAISLERGLNPTPFLLGFCFACNTGSAATIIGSPQNMIAAQILGISFAGFSRVALLPSVVSLPVVWAVVSLIYRGRWRLAARSNVPANPEPNAAPALDMRETVKTAIVMAAVILAFVFSDWPRDAIALAAAGIMLVNRQIASKEVLGTVDGNLILLLMGLFVVNAAFADTGLPQRLIENLRIWGVDFANPIVLFLVISVLSNIIGNNPAVMLVAPLLPTGGNADTLAASLALGTGFSSNIIVFGSLAGIIVVEESARRGIDISLREFCRAGIPVALGCTCIALAWIWWL